MLFSGYIHGIAMHHRSLDRTEINSLYKASSACGLNHLKSEYLDRTLTSTVSAIVMKTAFPVGACSEFCASLRRIALRRFSFFIAF